MPPHPAAAAAVVGGGWAPPPQATQSLHGSYVEMLAQPDALAAFMSALRLGCQPTLANLIDTGGKLGGEASWGMAEGGRPSEAMMPMALAALQVRCPAWRAAAARCVDPDRSLRAGTAAQGEGDVQGEGPALRAALFRDAVELLRLLPPRPLAAALQRERVDWPAFEAALAGAGPMAGPDYRCAHILLAHGPSTGRYVAPANPLDPP
jgi:hypothetical protein